MTKRFLILILAAVMLISLAACGKKQEENIDPIEDEEISSETGVSGVGRNPIDTSVESGDESETEEKTQQNDDRRLSLAVFELDDKMDICGFAVTELPFCSGILEARNYTLLGDAVADIKLRVNGEINAVLRVAGNEYAGADISGVFTEFDDTGTIVSAGKSVDWNATDDGEYLLRWMDSKFVYSLYFENASENLALGLIDDFIEDTVVVGESIYSEPQTEESETETDTETDLESEEETEPQTEPVRTLSIDYDESSYSHYDDDGMLLLNVSYKYPVLSGTDGADAINSFFSSDKYAFEQNAQEYQIHAKEAYDDNSDAFVGFELYIDYSKERSDAKVVSFSGYMYDYTGGPHPNGGMFGESFNAQTGEHLKLEDITDNLIALRTFVVNRIKSELKDSDRANELYNGYEDSIISFVCDNSWCLTDEGIMFYCNPYIIAPHAAGVFEFTIPYADIAEYVIPEILPE